MSNNNGFTPDNMIDFEVCIYEDALSLLLNNETDIKAEILNQLQQGDPCLEDISDTLKNLCDELVLDTEEIIARFEEDTYEELMKYVSFSNENITFDYGESAACGDLRMCVFRIPCKFDAGKYIKDIE